MADSTQPKPPAAAMMLSRDDVDRLLRDDSPDSRSTILEKVAGHYNGHTLTEREQEIAEHIFRLLMRDLSIRVRQTLSERMKDNESVPRDIVLHLANDVESVAVPVLRDSKVLSDADLVNIVETSHDLDKLLAITERETVSERVSGALVETQYAQVVTSLLGNEGAEITTNDLGKIASEMGDNDEVAKALAQVPNLPLAVVERLITRASEAVASELKEKYNVSDDILKEDSARAREVLMLRLLEGDLDEQEMASLVTQMWENKTLSPSIMMTALCKGQNLFFTMALAKMAKVPLSNAAKLVNDRGVHGFAGIYQKSGLPETMMDAMRIIVRAVQDMEGDAAPKGSILYANRLTERVLEQVGDQDIEYIPYFLALIRQNSIRRA